MKLVSSHLAAHTLYPNMTVKLPGMPDLRSQTEISVKACSNPSHRVGAFIDESVEAKEIEQNIVISTSKLLQLEC